MLPQYSIHKIYMLASCCSSDGMAENDLFKDNVCMIYKVLLLQFSY